MGFTKTITAVVISLLAISLYFEVKKLHEFPKKPKVENTWWGPGSPSKTDAPITEFKINISEDVSFNIKINL